MVTLNAKKQIEINRISAVLTIKLKESRPDLVFLMKNLEKLKITQGERLNLQLYLDYLNLVRDGVITTSGERAIETGMVDIPESGFYDLFYLSQKELGLDAEIIHFERKSPDKNNTEGKTIAFDTYKKFDRKNWTSWKEKELEFSVYFERSGDNPPKIIRKGSIGGEVTLNSNNNSSTHQLLKVSANDFSYETQTFTQFDLDENLSNLIENWNNDIKVKYVTFEEVKDKSENLRNFKMREHGLKGKLIFADAQDDDTWSIDIDHIDIVPKDFKDTKLWLGQLLLYRLKQEQCHATFEYCEDIIDGIIDDSPLVRAYPNISLTLEDILKAVIALDNNSILDDIQTAEDLYPDESFLSKSPIEGVSI